MDGQTGRRGFLRFGLSMLAMGLGGASIAGPALAQAVALRADGNGARLTLPLGPTERWRLTATARPARLRLHLPGGWKGPNRLAGAGPGGTKPCLNLT